MDSLRGNSGLVDIGVVGSAEASETEDETADARDSAVNDGSDTLVSAAA